MSDHYDLVVVGAGIQGVGVAQAAAAEGYSVLVLDKTGVAEGTSSKSSKLIHGGLRYLESWEFSLVRECLRERAILLKIAPELVKMRRFIIPVYEHTRRPPLQILIGLKLYHALANFRSQAKPGRIESGQWSELDGLSTERLKSVFYYFDAQTDDRKLTQAVMNSAQSLGAKLLSPATFVSANTHGDGCEINYLIEGEQRTCSADVLVNAGGPWVNSIAQKITPQPEIQQVDLVGGTHILLDGQLSEGIYYTESPRDGRAIFVMPWYGKTLVGTTERKYRDLPDLIKPSLSEQNYLLSVVKHYFPKKYGEHKVADIDGSFAGLRVLPKGNGHAFHRTREVIFKTDRKHKPRILSIYGGKLTAYRATAQDAMSHLRSSLPSRVRLGNTEEIRLYPPS